MTYEAVMERVKSVPPDKLDALNEYIVYLEQGGRKSCLSEKAEDISEKQKAFDCLMSFAGRITRDVNYKKELEEVREMRYEKEQCLD